MTADPRECREPSPALAGKVVVVTGGNSGIGAAVCRAFAAAGARVAVAGRRAERCAEVAAALGGQAEPFPVDVADAASVAGMMAAVAARWGGVDILINNAGLTRGRGLADSTPEDFRTVMETNVNGSFHCSREAYRWMRARGGGHIVMLASQAAGWHGAGELVYGVSKTAQVKLLLHILDEFAYANRAVGAEAFFAHAICPGAVDTPWHDGRASDRTRMLRADEVAELVLAVARHPREPREFFERQACGQPYRVGPVGIFAPHPNIIRIWRD